MPAGSLAGTPPGTLPGIPPLNAGRLASSAGNLPPNTGSAYVDPFRFGGVTGQRIDQGVDYAARPGTPIGALGPGRIVAAESSGSGWPGGGFIAELLSAGPARGQVVYTAENVAPAVTVGQRVKAGQPIGQFTAGGIESGWGTRPPNVGQALAYGTQSAPGPDPGAYSTGYGIAFNQLIRKLGGPAGIMQATRSGTAPALFSSPGTRPRAAPKPAAKPLPPRVLPLLPLVRPPTRKPAAKPKPKPRSSPRLRAL